MDTPIKDLLKSPAAHSIAVAISKKNLDFSTNEFIKFSCDGIDALPLKERSARITDALQKFLPNDFQTACKILVASLDDLTDIDQKKPRPLTGVRGWNVSPMADYIARFGLSDVSLALTCLREMTIRFSSEFAIRPFIENAPETTFDALKQWVKDDNHHVRRLVSEGTRTRLPWAMRLNKFIDDPEPVIQLLEQLKDDPSEYVRRSVANNLNDISKDHPEKVTKIANQWIKGATKNRERLIRHALRGLIKAGDLKALTALGYSSANIILPHFNIKQTNVVFGEVVEFEIEIKSLAKIDQPLIIDYAVHHMRANGKQNAKVFKWKMLTLEKQAKLNISKRHAIKPISTRRYYSGQHSIEIIINGKSYGRSDFLLTIP